MVTRLVLVQIAQILSSDDGAAQKIGIPSPSGSAIAQPFRRIRPPPALARFLILRRLRRVRRGAGHSRSDFREAKRMSPVLRKARWGAFMLSAAAMAALPLAAALADEAPAAAAAAAAPKIDSGDTAWMLTSVALVLMMTIPGLALFYGGMVRKMNVLATVMQSFAITCLVPILWAVVTYSLAFTPGSGALAPYIGGLDRLFLNGMAIDAFNADLAKTIPESVYMCFQMTFAIITPALICGSFADRMKFSAMLWFIGLWAIVVYAPVAHWVWDPS